MNASAELQLPDLPGPLHERMASAVEEMIATGRFRTGDRLPTHRELARQAGVAIGTVTKAIELLSARGVLRGEVGRGTFIADPRPIDRPGEIVDLTINGPPPIIDADVFAVASRRAAESAAALPSSGYADLRGTLGQREVVSSWLGRTRFEVPPDRMLLCVGAQHGIHLSFKDLKRVSRSIATEAATFAGAIAAAADLEMEMLAVAHDGEGMLPEDLDRVLSRSGCRIVYTTPVCQNPLGFEVGAGRRREILKVCIRHDAYIVEDDIYSVYSTNGAPTYKELDPERTYHLTSLSKCLTPLVRLGVLVPPSNRRSTIARSMRAALWGPCPMSIELGCAFLELEADVTAAHTLRTEAKARIGLAASVLRLDRMPMPEGAPHFWLPMSANAAEKLARRSSERGVRLTPPDATSIGGEDAGGVRLCVMAPARRSDLERALRVVSGLIDSPEEAIV